MKDSVGKALLLLSLTAFLDATDSHFFKGVFRTLEVEFDFDMQLFAMMQMAMSGAAVVFNPVWATLLDQGFLSQQGVLVLTALGWGLVTLLIALAADSAGSIIGLRFINQIFICSSQPIAQSIVSSWVPVDRRGSAFSAVAMAGGLGVVVSVQVSTAIAEQTIFGLAGWRIGLLTISLASLTFAGVVAWDLQWNKASHALPAKGNSRHHISTVVKKLLEDLRTIRRTWCFWLIALVCCFYQIWMNAIMYSAMWLQYEGVPNVQAGSLVASSSTGIMVGHVIFGFVGDAAHRFSPMHGRICVAQICCFILIPFGLILFNVIPGCSGSFTVRAILFFLIGFLEGGWGIAANRVILTMVVPISLASSVMAWKNVIEQVFAMLVCPFLVAWISGAHGYHSSKMKIQDMPPDKVSQNAAALSWTLAFCLVVGHVGMFLMYCFMHLGLHRDLDRLPPGEPSKQVTTKAGYTSIGAPTVETDEIGDGQSAERRP